MLEEKPILKSCVNDLQVGDAVYIEDEFGEYTLHNVKSFSGFRNIIKIGDWRFTVATGGQYQHTKKNNKELVFGSMFESKRIHLGNGMLFTEEQRKTRYKTRQTFRDRKKLIDQIRRATISDWMKIENPVLLKLVTLLARSDHLELNILQIPYDESTSQETN